MSTEPRTLEWDLIAADWRNGVVDKLESLSRVARQLSMQLVDLTLEVRRSPDSSFSSTEVRRPVPDQAM